MASCVRRDWRSEPFFDGTICNKKDLKRVFSFTPQDDVQTIWLVQRRSALVELLAEMIPLETQKTFPGCERGIVLSNDFHVDWEWMGRIFKQFHRSYEDLRKLIDVVVELYEVEEASSGLSGKAQCHADLVEYETSLYDGRLQVRLALGCATGMAGDYHELLDLEGDIDSVARVWEFVALNQSCRRCGQKGTIVEIRQTEWGLCRTCEAERKAESFQTHEEEREWIREGQTAKALRNGIRPTRNDASGH